MKRDYLNEVLKVVIATLVLLLLFGVIPDFHIKYKHFNFLSDIQRDRDPDSTLVTGSTDSICEKIDSSTTISAKENVEIVVEESNRILPIHDYSDQGSLASFFSALKEQGKRPVRIGVLGDSFIEADIFTSDLRALLQKRYGGKGLGFLPITAPAAQYRKNVKHTFSGWNTQSMIHFKNADWKKLSLSGVYFTPKEDAFVSYALPKGEAVSQARFFFINKKNTTINVSINNQPAIQENPVSSDSLQFLAFSDTDIQSISISVNNVEGFTAFGVFMDDAQGVYVDNFSVRGSSGSVLSTINEDLSKRLSQYVHYDLLILQHGLNVISLDGKGYPAYKKLMINAVKHLQECYPGTPVLMMSVGDKGQKSREGVETHPGVEPLIAIQEEVARATRSSFWNTFLAMGGKNGIIGFVQHTPPMAAKDYTHINHLGGKEIAQKFFESLMWKCDSINASHKNSF